MWNRAPSWPPAGSQPPVPVSWPPAGDLAAWGNGVNPSNPLRAPAATAVYSPDPYLDGQWAPVLAPVPTVPGLEQIRADGYVPPYSSPHDLDDYGRETDEMVRAYLDFHRKEPAVRSAVDGKAAAVAALDVIVKPRDKNAPNDVAAAAWVKEQLDDTAHGPDGLILNILRPAFVLGWSVNEKTLRGVQTPKGPRWGLKHCKSKDTANLSLRLDAFRNVVGIVNRVRGLHTHDPDKVILFTHADMFSNPYGQSDLRAAYRSANLINDAYQVWYVAIKVYSGPFLKGSVADDTRRKQMEAALKAARAAGFIVSPKDDDVEILNLATATSFDAFEKKVRIHREEIYLAVRNAYMPFMQSSSGGADQRGDTGMNKHAAADPVEYLLAKAVGRVLSHQLVPDLVEPNFPAGTGMPIVLLGGVNWQETKTQLEVAEKLKTVFGLDTSAEYLYTITQMPPPKGAEDTPPGPAQPGPQPGAPGGGPPADPTAAAAPPGDPADEPFLDDVTGEALDALGVPAGDGTATFAATFAGPARREGEVWQVGGHWWTIRSGHPVRAHAPGAGAAPANKPALAPPTKPGGQSATAAGAHPGGMVSVRDAIAKHGDDAGKAIDELRGHMKEHMDKGGKVSLWFDGKEIPVARVEGDRVLDPKGQPWGMLPLAMGTPGTKNGVEFKSVAQPAPAPAAAPKILPPTKPGAAAAPAPAPKPAAPADDEAARVAWDSAPAAKAAVAKALPAAAPKVAAAAAKANKTEVLKRAAEWADRMAEKHADRVAAHLGINRASAKYVLADTIKRLCRMALEGGGSAGHEYTGKDGQTLKIGVARKNFAQDADAPDSPFPPAAAGKYATYFAPSRHGHYPGDMHEQFGLEVPAFADATKLQRKQVRGRDGEPGWAWAEPKEPAPVAPPVTVPAPVPTGATFAAGHPAAHPLDALADELLAEIVRRSAA